jgi:hypothetical protein
MKKGLFAVMALLTIFAMIGCDNNPDPGTGNNITIKFDLDGGPGTKPTDVTITKGSTLGNKYPNMEGDATHEFLGWFNGTTEITRDTALNASVTLKAKWEILPEVQEGYMRITFNLNGAPGTPPTYIDLLKGTAITEEQIPDDPEWAGHTFEGWYNGNTKLVAGLSWQKSIVFTAKWSAISGGGLTPWKPDEQPEMPTTGYKNFYGNVTDPDEWKYSTFAGTGNVGIIEANSDGTYTVTIPTVPSGRSIVSFNSDTYMFKNGYYLLFDFPTNTEAKPIAAAVLAASGSANEDGAVWNTIYNVNTETGWAPTLDDVYLAGEIAFARDDLASINTLYKSVLLELVWNEDEEAEYYEFTLKKILITTGEDLTPPDPNTLQPFTPPAKDEPTDWVTFPGTETLRATFYPWNSGNKLEGNTVTVVAPATGRTLVRFLGTDFNWAKGYYLSVTLPNNSNKPQKIYSLGTEKDDSDGQWAVSALVEAEEGKFLAGRVDFTWASDESTVGYTGVMLDIYWYAEQTETMYTFTINKILVAGEATEGPPAETPDIHETSKLDDATYALNATAEDLVVVPRWTDNSSTYTYEWWQDTSTNQSTWPATNTGVTTANFNPPTTTEGFFYYYCVVKYPAAGTQKLTRVIKITVGNPTPPEPPAETPVIHDTSELNDATYALNATAAPLKVVPAWTANSSTYTYEWWQDTSPDQSTWPATNTGVTTDTYTPPTTTAGTFYYYCVVKYPTESTQALTRVIKIIVN